MKYIVIINDEEILAAGDESTLATVTEDVTELLRSGYYDVETVVAATNE